MIREVLLALPLIALLPLAACTTNPATGQSSFTAFMSPDDERRVGAEEHPKLVQQMGGEYSDSKLAAYVDRVGQSLAKQSEMPGERWTFTVIDSEEVNAFALPGGFIHVTRGLLALADNEAELAGVLAHELGHVTGRHAAQQYSRGMATNIGLGIFSIIGSAAGLPWVSSDLAAFGAQAWMQSYSRDQELQADTLAVRYMTRAGYDPEALVSFFRKLDAYSRLQAQMAGEPGNADRFNIMSSHPRTVDRIQAAAQMATIAHKPGERIGQNEYLAAIDGMIYGDSPEEGIRNGRQFVHPGMRIAFEVPPGFAMINSATKVVARGPQGSMMLFDAERAETARGVADLRTYLTRSWANGARLDGVETFSVGDMPAVTAATRVSTASGTMDARLIAIREAPDRLYRFIFLAPPQVSSQLTPEFQRTAYSFRRLSAAEAAAIKPLRVRVVTAQLGDTQEKLAAEMPFDKFRMPLFQVINGFKSGEAVKPGEPVKLIRS